MLDKIQNFAEKVNEAVSTPEGVHRLFDLVKAKSPELRVAFYFALKNTVVASDMDQAQRYVHTHFDRFLTFPGPT